MPMQYAPTVYPQYAPAVTAPGSIIGGYSVEGTHVPATAAPPPPPDNDYNMYRAPPPAPVRHTGSK